MGQQRLATRVRENYVLPLLLLLPFPRKIPFWYICIGPLLKTHKFIWCSKQFCEAGFTQNQNCNSQSKTILKKRFDSFLMLWFEVLLKMICRGVLGSLRSNTLNVWVKKTWKNCSTDKQLRFVQVFFDSDVRCQINEWTWLAVAMFSS